MPRSPILDGEKSMSSTNRKRIVFSLLAFLILFAEAGCMDKKELDQQEKNLLADIERFNKTQGSKGWNLENRRFTDEVLKGIKLFNSTWAKVDLGNINLSGAEIRNSLFRELSCNQTDFSGARLENVKFESCSMIQTDFGGSVFIECEFIDCAVDEIRMEKAVFRDCKFKGYKDESGIYQGGRFESCRFESCNLSNGSFYFAFLEKCEFAGGKIENTAFSSSELRSVKLANLAVDHCSFNDVKSVELTFLRCSSQGLWFGGSELALFTLKECREFNIFSLSKSSCKGMTISHCELLSEPMFHLSRIENLDITDSQIDYLDGEDTEYGGTNRIVNTRLRGLNLARATVSGLRIENCRIEDLLFIAGAKFDNLTLQNIEYMDGLEIKADSVIYINSNKFPDS